MKGYQFVIVLFLLGVAFFVGQRSSSDVIPVGENKTIDLDSLVESKLEEQVKEIPVQIEEEKTNFHTVSNEDATINLFKEAAPSVCYINTSSYATDYWNRRVYEQPSGSGSGFIWDEQGHIVTNYHVIQGASKATVTLSNQKTYEASLVGVEPNKDLAVLKISVENELIPIPIGTSDNLQVGQFVYAIGNPFGLDQTLTTGVISALGREIESLTQRPIRDVIQTDAAINPGNSGGPLLDSKGRLIGVNTQIYSPSGASAGIGFSIPVDVVKWVVPDLIKFGEVKRPAIGVSLLPQQYAQRFGVEKGIMISDLVKNGPAQKAGLKALKRKRNGSWQIGDIITGINNKKTNSYDDLVLCLEKYEPGEVVEVNILRGEEELTLPITLGESD